MSLQYLMKEVRDEVDILHSYKHKSFLYVDFKILGIIISCKVTLTLFMGKIKHSQSTKSNKFEISLQYLKKGGRDGVHFLHADKHQNFFKFVLSFLMEVASHVQSTQTRKLVIFLERLQKKSGETGFIFYCDGKHSDIFLGSSHSLLLAFLLHDGAIVEWRMVLDIFNGLFRGGAINQGSQLQATK